MNSLTLPQTVDEAIHKLVSDYSSCDPDALYAIASPSFLGVISGSDEVLLTAEGLHTALCRDFSRYDQISLELSDLHVREEIRAAWMMAACRITTEKGGLTKSRSGRISAVFRKTIPGWQIAMLHLTIP